MNHVYEVYHRRHGDVVAVRKTRAAARKKADQLDLAYGAIIYGIREVVK
jgi:hypothetical protein